MDQLSAHRRAQDIFAGVLANVEVHQHGAASPCDGWDARAVVDHVVGGNQWVAELAGKEVAALPDGLIAAHAASASVAHEVFAAPDGLTRSFQLPFGTVPGSVFISLRTSDVFTHAWDLAKATGQPTDLDPEVARFALEAARGLMSPDFRGAGRPFADEQPCPPEGPEADQLAAFLGRTV